MPRMRSPPTTGAPRLLRGSRGPDEVVPFLRRVTAGREIPDARLEAVGRALLRPRRPQPDQRPEPRPAGATSRRARPARPRHAALWGNRNSAPFFTDALQRRWTSARRRVLTVLTSAYSCYSSCRQYREDLAAAVDGRPGRRRPRRRQGAALRRAPRASWRRPWRARWSRSVSALPDRHRAHLVFVTHSVPDGDGRHVRPGDGEGSLYVDQHLAVAAAVTDGSPPRLGRRRTGELVFCSRSGPPTQPWLEPDVNDRIEEPPPRAASPSCCVPIGFVSDHMEVVLRPRHRGRRRPPSGSALPFARAATPGTDALFVAARARPAARARRRRRAARWSVPERWLPGDLRPAACLPAAAPTRAARSRPCAARR